MKKDYCALNSGQYPSSPTGIPEQLFSNRVRVRVNFNPSHNPNPNG